MSNYSTLKDQHPELTDCFFAFGISQLEEGLKKHNLKKEDIVKAAGGLFGTPEGIKKLYSDYEEISKQITETCDPQEVYDYEFANHECSYVGDDEEAIKLVCSYFSDEKSALVKRRFAVTKIKDLKFD